MFLFFTNLMSAFLLPPVNLILVALAGLLILRSHPRLGRPLVIGALVLLWLCATPYFAGSARRVLESYVKPIDIHPQSADAIVVLSAGTYFHAPEYRANTVSELGLVRVRYAANVQRATGKSILVSGGKPVGNGISEAEQMKLVLEHEFKVPVRWTEDTSRNTLEQARNSYRLLQEAEIKRIYLVTHAWHMPRAAMAFKLAGFEVIQAPTAYDTHFKTGPLDFVPSARALDDSWIVMHELMGMVWYWLRA